MAQMIPPMFDNSAPPGERDVFSKLKDDSNTDGWIVLHSLEISRHVKKAEGEADFVVIVPGRGVLVLEIKSHTSVACEHGVWHLGADPPTNRGPFKQASQAAHSIRREVIHYRNDLKNIPYWSAVVFPFVNFDKESSEWHQWQIIDRRMMEFRSLSELLENVLEQARRHLQEKGAAWFSSAACAPSDEECRAIAQILRPRFQVFGRPGDEVDLEIKRFTEEQYGALDAMELNPRVLFEGPAGTGKTVLALEAARRSARSGKRTLFVCYNRLLGKWLEAQTKDFGDALVVGTLHRQMMRVAGESDSDVTFGSQSYWDEELPLQAAERVIDSGSRESSFDELIVDEAQDIFWNRAFLDFLDLSLEKGLIGGSWKIFGDFQRQAIYSQNSIDLNSCFADFGLSFSSLPKFRLVKNCRNTPKIASLVNTVTGLDPEYRDVLRPDNGVRPVYRLEDGDERQLQMLLEVLNHFRGQNVRLEKVAILSPKSEENCLASKVKSPPWKDLLRPFANAGTNKVGYGSIHSFKGLEAHHVIVTDLKRIQSFEDENLLYIALTRALASVTLIGDHKVSDDLTDRLEA